MDRGWSVFKKQKLPPEARMAEPPVASAERSAAAAQTPSLPKRLLPRSNGVQSGGPGKRLSEKPKRDASRPLARHAPTDGQCASPEQAQDSEEVSHGALMSMPQP